MNAPLRSGTHCSKAGYNRQIADDRAQIERHVSDEGLIQANDIGSAMLISTIYPPFEGEIDNGPFLRIALATGPSTRLVQHIGHAKLEGMWRPGTLAISPPKSNGIAKAGRTEIIGMALVPPSGQEAAEIDLDHVTALAETFQDDALMVSVIKAMHHDAAVHGASTAFFDAGQALILRRFSELRGIRPAHSKTHPLSDVRYSRVLAFVEDRLAYDLSVAQLAQVAGLDSSGFTRALRARTGLPPYAWLTQRRMKRASALLRSGLTVTQVAAMSGYGNPSKFASAFKRVTGYAPSQWKIAQRIW